MLTGVGNIFMSTLDLDADSLIGQQIFAPQCIAGVTITPEVTSQTAKCYINGKLTTRASRLTTEDWMLQMSYEYVDFAQLQLLLGELASEGAAKLPVLKAVTGAATFTESDINTTNDNVASLKLYNSTDAEFMTLVTTAPGPNEFQVSADATEATITLNAAQVGQTISYSYDKAYSSIESVGATQTGTQYDEVNDFKFSAVVSSAVEGTDAFLLVSDQISRESYPTIAFTGGNRATLEVNYRMITLPGSNRPFKLYKLDGATAA